MGYVTGAVSSSIVLINSNGKNEWFKSISIGTAVAALFGLGKEIADEKKYGGFNWADLGATALGGAIGSVTIKISINRYEKKHLL